MEDKRSRKPLLIILLLVVVAVLGAAMFASPTVPPAKVEEQLDSADFAK